MRNVIQWLRGFVSNVHLAGKDNSVDMELDPIRSEIGGQTSIGSAATSYLLFTLPSGKAFHMSTLIVSNLEAATNYYHFYDSTSTTTPVIPEVVVGAYETIAITDMKGVIFQSAGCYVQSTSYTLGSGVRVGGIIRDELPSE